MTWRRPSAPGYELERAHRPVRPPRRLGRRPVPEDAGRPGEVANLLGQLQRRLPSRLSPPDRHEDGRRRPLRIDQPQHQRDEGERRVGPVVVVDQ